MNFNKIYRNNFKIDHIFKRYCSYLNKQAHVLSNELDISLIAAKRLILKQRITINDEDLQDTINYCKKNGYTNYDLLKYPKLLNRKFLVLDQHYLVGQEGGIENVTVSILANFRKVFNMTVKFLKLTNYIPSKVNVAKSFMAHLNPAPTSLDTTDLTDEHAFSHIHLQVMKRYLMWRLDASVDDIETLFRIHKMIRNKSLVYLCENIKIADKLGFTKEKMLKYGYLLHNYPNYTKTVLRTMPFIAGVDLARSMRIYPKLVMVSPRNYKIIYKYLKEANIPDEAIGHSMNVFHLSPKTVKRCLDEIKSTPDLLVHLGDKKLLKIVIHNKRASLRMKNLRSGHLKCTSLHKLRIDDQLLFDTYIKEGKDKYLPIETFTFVKNLLNCNIDLIESKLKLHPFYAQVPLTQIQETYRHLVKLNFDNEDILKVLPILLYPVNKIDKAVETITFSGLGRISKVNKLNLILYHMEKVHHFDGNGIWLDEEDKE